MSVRAVPRSDMPLTREEKDALGYEIDKCADKFLRPYVDSKEISKIDANKILEKFDDIVCCSLPSLTAALICSLP